MSRVEREIEGRTERQREGKEEQQSSNEVCNFASISTWEQVPWDESKMEDFNLWTT